MRRIVFLFLFLISFFSSLTQAQNLLKVDETTRLFFPENLSELYRLQTDFSIFWWNFVVVKDFKEASELCQRLKEHIGKELNVVVCGSGLQIPTHILQPWAQDYVIREKFQPDSNWYQQKMNQTLTMASFVQDIQFLKYLQNDPFQSWSAFQEKILGDSTSQFIQKDDFLWTKNLELIVIPVQFKSKPSLLIVEPVIQRLGSAELIGMHGSSYRNEFQVKSDLKSVSVVAGIAFILFFVFLVYQVGWNVLLLAIPVSLSVLLAALITQWFYGDIHGLTLAFGSGIIGLALDYGLHGLLGKSSKQTWVSNFVGMLTTLCGVLILINSGIPLIQQMMIFSTLGLVIAFAMYYFIFKHLKNIFQVKDFHLILPSFKNSHRLILALIPIGLVGLFQVQLNLDLKKLSFMSKQELEYSRQVFDTSETFMMISSHDRQKNYAEMFKEKNISYRGVDQLMPNFDQQRLNLKSWLETGCKNINKDMSSDQKIFFKNYFEFVCQSENYSTEKILQRPYLKDFISQESWLGLITPKTEEQTHFVKTQIPEAQSIQQSLLSFSKILNRDLIWMIPLSLLLTVLILFFYYRRWIYTLTALVPFLIGMSLFFTVALILKIELDLISILGLVMVFGFSIDYGVFSTDRHVFGGDESVYTALSLASMTNTLGFFPMLFAKHPVLKQLGLALFFGTVGAYLGTVYIVKYFFEKDRIKS